MIPCNSIPDEILTDRPDRFRAMIVESTNPVHALASAPKFREAMQALEFSVVVDVAMTESARQATIVLPATSQYEKCEASFFNLHFPDNAFFLRKSILDPLPGTLPEPEMHARIVEALDIYDLEALEPLRTATAASRTALAEAYRAYMDEHPDHKMFAALILYRTLGPTLPDGLEGAAVVWEMTQTAARRYREQVRRAGIEASGDQDLGNALFDAILESDDGVICIRHEYDEIWDLTFTEDRRLRVNNPLMLDKLRELGSKPTTYASEDFPFILAAGERRSFTANVIIRDPDWRKTDLQGVPETGEIDAAEWGLQDGDRVRVVTPGGTAETDVAVVETMRQGHIALPNGFGVEHPDENGEHRVVGVFPNELTTLDWKDDFAGTPWHKHAPARLEMIGGVWLASSVGGAS